MNKWPKSVNVAGRIYPVKYIDGLVDENDLGQVQHRFPEMLIARSRRVSSGYRDLPEADVFETFLHELTHAMFRQNELLNAMIGNGDDAAQEKWIYTFAIMLADTLLRNGIVTLPDGRPK